MIQVVRFGTEAPARPRDIQKFERIHIIVNPSSGPNSPDLSALNKVLRDLDIDWDMFITRKSGDAYQRAKEAIAAGVDAIAVYGGDGTVLEVAGGVVGSDVPLVLIPGGTANVLSMELGIPRDVTKAALLLGGAPNTVRTLDMGALVSTERDGEADGNVLLFHVGIGAEGRLHMEADRDSKDRAGMFAYVMAALKTLSNPATARYHLLIDGQPVEAEGIDCMITVMGSIGVPGITLSHAVDVSDGLLDVFIVQDASILSLFSAAASAVTSGELARPLLQWQAREVTVVTDPPQPVAIDGELIEIDSVTVRVVPQAIRVVVPAPGA
jgi:YegS/Rv2252/BmrU family lipid kinase